MMDAVEKRAQLRRAEKHLREFAAALKDAEFDADVGELRKALQEAIVAVEAEIKPPEPYEGPEVTVNVPTANLSAKGN